jgi:hypothetical protein
MTKQRKPLNWTEYELCWGTYSPSGEFIPSGKTVRVTRETDNDALGMALDEQVFDVQGPASFAELLAWRLRQPSPSRAVLDQIARMLDPSDDGYLKLKVVRHRKGKTAAKYVNDAAIAKAFREIRQQLIATAKSKHGITGRTVKKVAELFEISPSKVRKAIKTTK